MVRSSFSRGSDISLIRAAITEFSDWLRLPSKGSEGRLCPCQRHGGGAAKESHRQGDGGVAAPKRCPAIGRPADPTRHTSSVTTSCGRCGACIAGGVKLIDCVLLARANPKTVSR